VNLTERLLGPNTGLATLVTELFEQLPDVDGNALESGVWDEALLDPARDILDRSGKGLRARLLERCFELAGGYRDELPELLPVLIELLHVGSLVIDDIEDDSPVRRGKPALHRRYGLPIALNTGNWFYFLPLALLSRVHLDDTLRLQLYQDISQALLRCHKGQALDLAINVARVSQSDLPGLVTRSTCLKTGSLMGLAATIGARSAGAPAKQVAAFARFGRELGTGLQMLDDWSSVSVEKRAHKGLEDVSLGRLTWPWAWLAQALDPPRFANLAARAADADQAHALSVMATMREELKATAPRRIHEHLANTIGDLQTVLGPAADLGPLKHDLESMERAYG